MIAPCVPRPASSPPPDGGGLSLCRPSGRPASTKRTSATAPRRSLPASFTSFGCGSAMSAVCAFACHRPSIHHLRPSATVAAWHPGPAAPFRGKASSRRRFARLHPRPGNGGTAAAFQPAHGSQPLLAIARDSLCLPLVVPYRIRQGLLQTNIAAISLGVNRPGCVPCQTGSRLFFAGNCNCQGSSHRSRNVGQRSLLGNRRASKHFFQYAGPSDNRTVMQSSRTLSTLCVYSPLRFAYGYITQTIIRRASRWRQLTKGSRCAFAFSGSGQVRPLLICLAASLSAPRFS